MGALPRIVGVVRGQGDVLTAVQQQGACHRQEVEHARGAGAVAHWIGTAMRR